MGFADRKNLWIETYGDPMTILRTSGNISTFARFVKGRQLLSPFDINFVRFMVFPVSSGIAKGDLVQNLTLGWQAFIMGSEHRTLLGSKAGTYTEMYLVNYPTTAIERQVTTYDNYGNVTGSSWNTVATVPMTIQHVNGNVPYKDGLLLADTLFRCTAQTSAGIELLDRVVIDGKNYQVSDINLSEAPNLAMIQVKTDNRT